MTAHPFKVGDKVRCIKTLDGAERYGITVGGVYTVRKTSGDIGVYLDDVTGGWWSNTRFELVAPLPPTVSEQVNELELELAKTKLELANTRSRAKKAEAALARRTPPFTDQAADKITKAIFMALTGRHPVQGREVIIPVFDEVSARAMTEYADPWATMPPLRQVRLTW